MPFSLTGASSCMAIWRSITRRVLGETITAPSSAADISRAARLTCWPITVYSWRRAEPTCPAKTTPVFKPTRCLRNCGSTWINRPICGFSRSKIS
jgi:hypothetical protein